MNATNTKSQANVVVASAPAPAIGSFRVIDGQHRVVMVTWLAGRRRGRSDRVDLSPLIDTHKFYAPLRKNPALFETARIIDDGYAIAWGDGSIDMSAASIQRLAEEAMTGLEFCDFLKRNELTHQAAAAALGRSKRQIEHYLQYEMLPRMVVLACIGYETRRAPHSMWADAIMKPSVSGQNSYWPVSGTCLYSGTQSTPYGWKVEIPQLPAFDQKRNVG